MTPMTVRVATPADRWQEWVDDLPASPEQGELPPQLVAAYEIALPKGRFAIIHVVWPIKSDHQNLYFAFWYEAGDYDTFDSYSEALATIETWGKA